MSDFVICSVGTNLNVLGPRDLAELPEVDRAEESLVCQRGENTTPNISGKVDDAFHAVGIREAKTES